MSPVATFKVYKTEAVILKGTELGEADEILTFYTPHLGKLMAVAKGARRPKSKLGGHLEPFTHNEMLLARGRNLDTITQIQTIESFLPLRSDLWRTSCALYVAELVNQFTPEGEENYPIFKLLLNALRWLSQTRDTELALRYFELHLLDYLGYQPQLEQCLSCNSPLKPATNYFSASGGGVLCPYCYRREPAAFPLSVNALKTLRFLQHNDYTVANRLRMSPDLSSEIERILRGYIRYLLERETKSAGWLNRIRKEYQQ